MALFFNIVSSILIPTLTGYALMPVISKNSPIDFTFKLAISYGLGLGLLTLWMFVLSILKIRFSLPAIGMPLILLILILALGFLRNKNKISFARTKNIKDLKAYSIAEKILYLFLLLFIAINIFWSFKNAISIPINSWDEFSTVAFKAKIFYFEKTIPDLKFLPHKTYPLFVPLSECWVAINLGHWSDTWIKIIFPFLLLSFLIVSYKFLTDMTNKLWGIIGCTLLFSSNFFAYHSTISYRDFSLMYFNCITIILLLYWMENRDIGFLITSSIFAGMATFTKLEGSAYLLIYLIIFLSANFSGHGSKIGDKLKNILFFVIPSMCICAFFHFYKIINFVTQDGTGINDKTAVDFTIKKIQLIHQIIINFIENLLFSGNWGIIWVLFFFSIVLPKKNKRQKTIKILLLSIFLFFLLYAGISIFTVNFIWIAGDLRDAGLSRLFLHFFPLSVLTIVLLNYNEKNVQ